MNFPDYSATTIGYMFLKLLLSAMLGAIVGYERQVHERPAGLRTHILVCVGSTLITLLSIGFGVGGNDPGRIAAQIVSGIGFLGAGTIMRQGSFVHGLTTAASLWAVAGIGMAAAMGGAYLKLAVFTTLIVFFTLSLMRRFESALGKHTVCDISVTVSDNRPDVIGTIINSLAGMDVHIESVNSSKIAMTRFIYKLKLGIGHSVKLEDIIAILNGIEGVSHFEFTQE